MRSTGTLPKSGRLLARFLFMQGEKKSRPVAPTFLPENELGLAPSFPAKFSRGCLLCVVVQFEFLGRGSDSSGATCTKTSRALELRSP